MEDVAYEKLMDVIGEIYAQEPIVNEREDLIVSIVINCPIVPHWEFTKRWLENWYKIWKTAPLEWFRFYSKVPTNPPQTHSHI